MTFIYCNKRKGNPRLEISVCFKHGCPHAHEAEASGVCPFIPAPEIKTKRRDAKKLRDLKKMQTIDAGEFIEFDMK